MTKIRVHELAKRYNKDNRDMLKILANHGIDVQSHMSLVTMKEISPVLEKLELNDSVVLFEKIVDQSLLKQGLTIPKEWHNSLLQKLDITLAKGEKKKINIWIQGVLYEAVLSNIAFNETYANRDVMQIRYAEGSPISRGLNAIFSHSVRKIEKLRNETKDANKQIVLPEGEREYVEVRVNNNKELVFNCLVKENVDENEVNNGPMRTVVNKWLNEYIGATRQSFAGHPMGSVLRNEIPNTIYRTGLVDSKDYLITGSVGQGNWAAISWVCIFDRKITTTAQKGVYIVYLLSKDGNSLYLTFNQGCTEISRTHSKSDTVKILQDTAKEIRTRINSRGFKSDDNINLGENLSNLGFYYQKGAIFYKEYKKGNVPSEEVLQDDLKRMMQIYKEYAGVEEPENDETQPLEVEEEIEVSNKEIIEKVKQYIASKGFYYEDGLIENFYLSLKSKPFVILAGTSGTGKTRLVRLFAEALGATTDNGKYKLVSVRPDWSDSSDLFGHMDLNGTFVEGAITTFVEEAEQNKTQPYFLCLDEMNLARVEYYLSDILSIMETRDMKDGEIVTDKIRLVGHDDLGLPENLYIIGTVNMDETTFPFSKKVLDRANTIEFSYVDLIPDFDGNNEKVEPFTSVKNDFLRTEYLYLHNCNDEEKTEAKDICNELQAINVILQKANAHIGYRVRDEIVFYMLNNKNMDLLDKQVAFDNEILQKILPRIQGSSSAVRDMLCELFKFCAGDYDGYRTDSGEVSKKMFNVLENGSQTVKYPKSAMKLAYMMRRYEEDGFTSYWL